MMVRFLPPVGAIVRLEIALENLEIPAYGLRNTSGAQLLQTPAISVKQGSILAITGPSGAGKSLFISSLFGWSAPHIKPIFATAAGAYLMVQDPSLGLTPRLTVAGHFKEVCNKAQLKNDAPALLAELGLTDTNVMNKRVEHFSGGERQRIMLALLLIRKPKVLVCDEPAASLDAHAEQQLWNRLVEQQERTGLTLFFITHNLNLIEQYADTVLMLEQGCPPLFASKTAFFEAGQSEGHRRLLENFELYRQRAKAPAACDQEDGENVLVLEDVGLAYGELNVIHQLNWKLKRGQWWWVTGASGSGKTSLAKVIAGLVTPQVGRVLLHGRLLHPQLINRPPDERIAIQYLFQHGSSALNPAKKVARQLRDCFDDQEELADLLRQLRLDHLNLNRGPAAFSLGETQRINLIRALARKPQVIIGDELLSALDLTTRSDIIKVLDAYRQRHNAVVVLITHDLKPRALLNGLILSLSGQAQPHLENSTEPTMPDYWFPVV